MGKQRRGRKCWAGRTDVLTARSGEGWCLTRQRLLFVKQTRKRYSILFPINDIYLGTIYMGLEPSLACSSCILSSQSWKGLQEMTSQSPARAGIRTRGGSAATV